MSASGMAPNCKIKMPLHHIAIFPRARIEHFAKAAKPATLQSDIHNSVAWWIERGRLG
jgi:hypothetical protein